MTHTYIQAIKQPTLHCLTRSVRRRAATSKRGYRKLEVLGLGLSGNPTSRKLRQTIRDKAGSSKTQLKGYSSGSVLAEVVDEHEFALLFINL